MGRGGGEEGLEAVETPGPAGADGSEGPQVSVRALHDPAPRHEALVLGATGLARVAGDVGREAQGLDPCAEAAVVEGAVGGKYAGRGAQRNMQVRQSFPGRREVVTIAARYGKGQDEPCPVDDRRPLRALLAPVEARRPPFSVRDNGAFTWQPSTARNDQSTAPAASAISKHFW